MRANRTKWKSEKTNTKNWKQTNPSVKCMQGQDIAFRIHNTITVGDLMKVDSFYFISSLKPCKKVQESY